MNNEPEGWDDTLEFGVQYDFPEHAIGSRDIKAAAAPFIKKAGVEKARNMMYFGQAIYQLVLKETLSKEEWTSLIGKIKSKHKDKYL
jgi:hypothetical protein